MRQINHKQLFSNSDKGKIIAEIKSIAWEIVFDKMTNVGIPESIVNEAISIVRNGDSPFWKYREKLETFIENKEFKSKYTPHCNVIIADTMFIFSRAYNITFATRLELEWYEFSGALVKSSRPWCVAMERKRYIHRSEFQAICKGKIDGQILPLNGLIKGTNENNVLFWCGGHNCHHILAPIPAETVPIEIIQKIPATG